MTFILKSSQTLSLILLQFLSFGVLLRSKSCIEQACFFENICHSFVLCAASPKHILNAYDCPDLTICTSIYPILLRNLDQNSLIVLKWMVQNVSIFCHSRNMFLSKFVTKIESYYFYLHSYDHLSIFRWNARCEHVQQLLWALNGSLARFLTSQQAGTRRRFPLAYCRVGSPSESNTMPNVLLYDFVNKYLLFWSSMIIVTFRRRLKVKWCSFPFSIIARRRRIFWQLLLFLTFFDNNIITYVEF